MARSNLTLILAALIIISLLSVTILQNFHYFEASENHIKLFKQLQAFQSTFVNHNNQEQQVSTLSPWGELTDETNCDPSGISPAEDLSNNFVYIADNSQNSQNMLLKEREEYLEYLERAQSTLKGLLGHKLLQMNISLVDYVRTIFEQDLCRGQGKPVFFSMGKVSSTLVYSFGVHFRCRCSRFDDIMVLDEKCMNLCAQNNFPCYNYHYIDPTVATFEQVAAVKLFHVGEALNVGVNLMLLDLDVGFLRDPMILFEGFLDSDVQILCQMDIGHAMDKRQGMTWFTFPRVNFGLFLVKSSELTSKVFTRAWKIYQKLTPEKKALVASDQSVVQGAMSNARFRFGLNFSYFYPGQLPDTSTRPVKYIPTLLLHKIERVNRHGIRFELGGDPSLEEIGTAIAVHATCYEKTSKLHALKATNSFWNAADYYNPLRRTITKPIMLDANIGKLEKELQGLVLLGLLTNRSIIVPNILIGIGKDRPQGTDSFLYYSAPSAYPDAFGAYGRGPRKSRPKQDRTEDWKYLKHHLDGMSMRHCAQLGNNMYWPAFRTIYSTLDEAKILEPGFYAKIEKQIFMNVPDPVIYRIDRFKSFEDIVNELKEVDYPRLVIDIVPDINKVLPLSGRPRDIAKWATDSASSWGGSTVDPKGYIALPRMPAADISMQNIIAKVSKQVRLCHMFLYPTDGNRTCFNKCN